MYDLLMRALSENGKPCQFIVDGVDAVQVKFPAAYEN